MTEQDKPQDTTSPTPEPSKERDRLAAYRGDLAGAERQASQVVSLGRQQVFMGLGMVGFFLSLFCRIRARSLAWMCCFTPTPPSSM